jgi:hypothetical protein
MRKITLLALTAFVAALAPEALAFKMQTKQIPNQAVFGVQVEGTSMSFYGQADAILSVSFQEYTTGPLIVSEVVIDLRGSNQQLRIYASRARRIPSTAASTRRRPRASPFPARSPPSNPRSTTW